MIIVHPVFNLTHDLSHSCPFSPSITKEERVVYRRLCLHKDVSQSTEMVFFKILFLRAN